jgi:Ca2+-binding EF-hand superfamily protein
LKGDWAKIQGLEVSKVQWDKSSITFPDFKRLMEDSWDEKELKNLFNLYDVDGNGTISWREYICVCISISPASHHKIWLLLLAFIHL